MNIIKRIIEWFETGDLVPLIVIVSAVHYSDILSKHDILPVAIAIGLMVDLGHFRSVRAAVRYSGKNQKEYVVRWLVALFMTSVSVVYQQRFYNDWWLSLPLPLLIVSLSWLQYTDRLLMKQNQSQSKANPKPAKRIQSKTEAIKPAYQCELCGFVAKSQNALNGHMRKHSKISANGNGHSKEQVKV